MKRAQQRVRLAAAYCARRDGYSWPEIAGACGYASPMSALMCTRAFARRVGLPWPIAQVQQ